MEIKNSVKQNIDTAEERIRKIRRHLFHIAYHFLGVASAEGDSLDHGQTAFSGKLTSNNWSRITKTWAGAPAQDSSKRPSPPQMLILRELPNKPNIWAPLSAAKDLEAMAAL